MMKQSTGIGLLLSVCACLWQTGCGGGQHYAIELHNRSAKAFNGVQVLVDGTLIIHDSLRPGQSIPPLEVGQVFGSARQQLSATAIFYAADTVVRSSGPYNGMIHYKRYKITIDSSLQVKWTEGE
jgi:hypothetical protein